LGRFKLDCEGESEDGILSHDIEGASDPMDLGQNLEWTLIINWQVDPHIEDMNLE
jgi:hypothetical protein